jgi:hypothetical protein
VTALRTAFVFLPALFGPAHRPTASVMALPPAGERAPAPQPALRVPTYNRRFARRHCRKASKSWYWFKRRIGLTP